MESFYRKPKTSANCFDDGSSKANITTGLIGVPIECFCRNISDSASVFICQYVVVGQERDRSILPPPDKPADPIIVHPDVRRVARVRAFTEFATQALLAHSSAFRGLETR